MRLRRKLFTGLSLLSLLLCIALSALWVRSYRVWHSLVPAREDRNWVLSSGVGQVSVCWHITPELAAGLRKYGAAQGRPIAGWVLCRMDHGFSAPLAEAAPRLIGFEWTSRPGYRAVVVPHWVGVVPLLVLPVAWLRRWWRSWRAERLGLCKSCGYDLRASTERCPECGQSISAKQSDALSAGRCE